MMPIVWVVVAADVDEGGGVAVGIGGDGVTVMAPVSDTSVGMASFVLVVNAGVDFTRGGDGADVDVTDMQDGMGDVGGANVVVDVVNAKVIPPI
jgi:hypothetical protein